MILRVSAVWTFLTVLSAANRPHFFAVCAQLMRGF
jgi:hypothetical protein